MTEGKDNISRDLTWLLHSRNLSLIPFHFDYLLLLLLFYFDYLEDSCNIDYIDYITSKKSHSNST